MKNWIIHTFIKNYEDIKNPEVREKYGSVAGIVGIISNLILCTLKILVGIIFNSIAILADGVNNLSDASASLITLFGFKISSKAPDKDHPYGHGRAEYLTGLAISVMIVVIGFQLFTSSLDKTIHPEPIEFSYLMIFVLVGAILIKLWQASFYITVGKKINSDALAASAADSKNDVISTLSVLVATIVSKVFNITLDGPIGICVAIFIFVSGISLFKETIAPILGQNPDPAMVEELKEMILSNEEILGLHDLIVHDYGPGRLFASVHTEVDGSKDVFDLHDTIDNIENEVIKKMGILLTIHLDPVMVGNPLVDSVKAKLLEITESIPGLTNLHDVRVVEGPTHTNVVFDIVREHDCEYSKEEIKSIISEKLKEYDQKFVAVPTIDNNYI